ncbi:MAG TPA: hypothetical protein VII38_09210 [Polyangia bacterium]|jgi:drug/metabolite transporter (DMT)-like permease
MRLLTAHKILVGFAIALAAILIVWGTEHGLRRQQPNAWVALALGAAMLPVFVLYLRKLYRHPPVR